MYQAPTFDEDTTVEEVEDTWKKRKEVYGNRKVKVGKCALKYLNTRYGLRDRFKILTAESVVCYCKMSVATLIEGWLMDIVLKDGFCANSYKDLLQQSHEEDGECDACVYMTELKDIDILRQCPIAKCKYVTELQYINEHMKSHAYYNIVKSQLDELRRKKKPVPENIRKSIEPTPYRHRVLRSVICEWCGLNFEGAENPGPSLAAHRSICHKNQRSTFACMEPDCHHKSASLSDYEKHQREHDRRVKLVKREGEVECRICGAKFPSVKRRTRHEKVHLKPDEKPQNVCPHCEKSFTRLDIRQRHGRNIHGCTMTCCNPPAKEKGSSTCPLCGKNFANFANMKRHFEDGHKKKLSDYQ